MRKTRPTAGEKNKAGKHFYVQPFRLEPGKNGTVVLGQMQELRNADAALTRALELSCRFPGVVAYEIEMDADGDVVDEPIVLARHGIAEEEQAA